MNKNIYIVPHDFTAVGDAALDYAFLLGKHVQTEIQLLHLVESSSNVAKAAAKMDQVIQNAQVPDGIELVPVVRVGSIFEEIGNYAIEQGARLIIMGTHGALGLQKLFGSNAMKVVTSTEVPFLIVQKDTVAKDISNIIVPIDLSKESLQIINTAGDLADIFGATVHVVGERKTDPLLAQQMKNRILIVKNQYEDREIKCQVEFVEGGGSYQKKIMNYCKEKQIDFIAFAYHTESLLPQFDSFAQSLITNSANLPCMVINSKQASALYF